MTISNGPRYVLWHCHRTATDQALAGSSTKVTNGSAEVVSERQVELSDKVCLMHSIIAIQQTQRVGPAYALCAQQSINLANSARSP